MQYIARRLTRKQIRKIAYAIRVLFGYEDTYAFPVARFLEYDLPKMDKKFHLIVLPDKQMDGILGEALPEEHKIILSESVYQGMRKNNGRDKSTVCHEIFHYLFHTKDNIVLAKRIEGIPLAVNNDPEWQSEVFSGELLIPHHLTKGMDLNETIKLCQVSLKSAKLQLRCYKKN